MSTYSIQDDKGFMYFMKSNKGLQELNWTRRYNKKCFVQSRKVAETRLAKFQSIMKDEQLKIIEG